MNESSMLWDNALTRIMPDRDNFRSIGERGRYFLDIA
jgi:hypothetical protein